MSDYVAYEKLSYAVSALVGPEGYRERLTKACGVLEVIRSQALVGKRGAFGDHDDAVSDYDRVMAAFDATPIAQMTAEQAGSLATQILTLYQRLQGRTG